jgi:PPE-repeat protein
VDYGLLPPEINSGRMYAGPGSGSMLAAAAAWDTLAVELHSTAAAYGSVVSGLASGPWVGPASAAMAAAAHSYVTWLHTTATEAEQTASQAEAAAGAHSVALAATVPPPVIAANRALLMQLIQTNIFGQNTPAIGTVEGQYAEMWAQDTAAMNGYAGSSVAASTLHPFTKPPQTTNPGRQAAQAASVLQAAGGTTGASAQSALAPLTTLASSPGLSGLASELAPISTLLSFPSMGFGDSMGSWAGAANLISNINNGMGLATFMAQHPGGLVEALNPPFAGLASFELRSAGVGAGMGQAITIGSISVPQSWAMPAPAISSAASAAPVSAAVAGPLLVDGIPGAALGETMMGTLAGRALGGTTAKAVANRNRRVIPQSPAAG